MSDLTYASYLHIDRLLSLQEPRSKPAEHDEMLFIVIHQVFELWFKEVLHEVEKVKRDFTTGDLFGAIHTFKRVRTIMKTLVGQLDILETMTPMSFSAFRERLDTASGFQSFQFRELEFVMGYKRPEMLRHAAGPEARAAIEKRLSERSLVDHFYDFLEKQGAAIPPELRAKPAEAPNAPNEALQREILRLYKARPELAILFELMTDLDEGFQEWKYRHVKLVERTIGNKKGTGGSLGVEFLKRSLFNPIFPDLWAIRHEL
ncbi:MAG TPA: tryptophan 2,3-dioxygenase family protein [Candidatus Bathyarchaeia archaeon]|nr:tryptophan 2,3-dioxygenase family protein [Candidatus Bathyarchaeia archaeon]